MRKLAALAAHILAVTGIPPEQVYAFADQGDLYPMGRDLGPWRPEPGEEGKPLRQTELGIFRYDAVIQIERYPGDGTAFAAMVAAWLAETDPVRDGLADPSLNIELNLRGGDADVEIAVEFEERLAAVEDENGDIPFDGTRWRMTEPAITPVTALDAIRAVNEGAGKKP